MENTPKKTFEEYGHENGLKYWYASDFSRMLGYASYKTFKEGVIKRAKLACMTANIDFEDDFRNVIRQTDNQDEFKDIKLSRFACYIVAMNSDTKKERVAKAQVYFAKQVEQVNILLEGAKDFERLEERDKIKVENKALAQAAKEHGVKNYGLFHDAGYKGLYNKGIKSVKEQKGIPQNRDHFDYMGKVELAANYFRIALTEDKLKNSNSQSEQVAKDIHNQIGGDIRKMVKSNTGKFPEELPIERRLLEVKKELKKIPKKLNKLDEDKNN